MFASLVGVSLVAPSLGLVEVLEEEEEAAGSFLSRSLREAAAGEGRGSSRVVAIRTTIS